MHMYMSIILNAVIQTVREYSIFKMPFIKGITLAEDRVLLLFDPFLLNSAFHLL